MRNNQIAYLGEEDLKSVAFYEVTKENVTPLPDKECFLEYTFKIFYFYYFKISYISIM